MSTLSETSRKILAKGNNRGIRDIPGTIRAGFRMNQKQLRFCLIVAVVLLIAAFLLMNAAGFAEDTSLIRLTG